MDDPLARLRLVLGYVVGVVWAISFIVILVVPNHDETPLLLVQAAMMLVLGGLYADRVRRKNGADK